MHVEKKDSIIEEVNHDYIHHIKFLVAGMPDAGIGILQDQYGATEGDIQDPNFIIK
jgi:hypothetical protein